MAKKKYYVVWRGNSPGIYESWDACKKQIEGFQDAVYKSFPSYEMAEQAYESDYHDYIGKDVRKLAFTKEQENIIGRPIPHSISVDAACSGNPGDMEYRGVYTKTGKQIFHMGPYFDGTVNLGEFLALVHGLAHLKKINSSIPIYSDSRTAMAWVRNKEIKTTLKRTPLNDPIFQLIDRAIFWLNNNEHNTKILKWETAYWGEIPADFGRK
jgi:ribonuclease HI